MYPLVKITNLLVKLKYIPCFFNIKLVGRQIDLSLMAQSPFGDMIRQEQVKITTDKYF